MKSPRVLASGSPESSDELPDLLPSLRARGPYDFERSFKRIVCAVVATRHPEMGQRAASLDDGEVALALRVREDSVVIGLRQEADGAIQPRVRAGSLSRGNQDRLAADLRRILCLDDDLEAFYQTVAADPPMAHLTRRFRGLRLALSSTAFQGLVHAIIFQQISYPAAQTVEDRLIARWGDSLSDAGHRYPLFPPVERLASLEMSALRSIGIPPRKAQAILTVAREAAAGALDLELLAAEGDAERASRRLQAIGGIGPWTAHHVIIRGMGMTNCLPVEDPGLRRAVAEQYGLPSPVDAEDLRRLASRWSPWQSYATYYLWNTFWQ